MDLNFSTMKISDLDSISDILLSQFDDFWNLQIFKQELANTNSYYLVAKSDEEIVGFGGVWQALDVMHITNIVTKKSFRNKGIASSLLKNLIAYCKNIKASSLTLEVNENNVPAIKLYEKYNFEKVGLRKKYYNGVDNAIIMTLNL